MCKLQDRSKMSFCKGPIWRNKHWFFTDRGHIKFWYLNSLFPMTLGIEPWKLKNHHQKRRKKVNFRNFFLPNQKTWRCENLNCSSTHQILQPGNIYFSPSMFFGLKIRYCIRRAEIPDLDAPHIGLIRLILSIRDLSAV